jgi:CheY-like chemotaxis protein
MTPSVPHGISPHSDRPSTGAPTTSFPRVGISPPPLPELVFCDVHEARERFAPVLRGTFQVSMTTTQADAFAVAGRTPPTLVVIRLASGSGDALAVCTMAKRCIPPATVLVITSDPSNVPDALAAGCDGVLLEPFAPNLLYARIGRLLRLREDGMGTNQFCANARCPHCGVSGVTSFEFHSHRRAWFACTGCRHVWLGRRVEESDDRRLPPGGGFRRP